MNYIIIQKEKEIFKLNIEDIYYIQTHPNKAHTVQIVTENASFDLFQNLSNLEKQYGETLTRCHRNCLVNLERLKSMEYPIKDSFSWRRRSICCSVCQTSL